ncbi:hypothetical protein ACFVGY_21570 [Streptomyces sp. NPDC127106]|uniref:hypothetical protein n=1 Tax=Streptomyces sp. NPDC127106 TaxID=3345360 RepID=UPI00362D67BC
MAATAPPTPTTPAELLEALKAAHAKAKAAAKAAEEAAEEENRLARLTLATDVYGIRTQVAKALEITPQAVHQRYGGRTTRTAA